MPRPIPRAALILLSLLLGACATAPFGVVPSIEAEKKLGEETMPRFLKAKGGIYSHSEATRYVRELTAKLSATVDIPEEYPPIQITILDTSEPSAYALPGGSIFVSRGMIAMANDEAQLAGVIAHEIGHVITRHVAEGIASRERLILDIINDKEMRLRRAGTRTRRIAIVEKELEARLGDITAFSIEQELEADQLAIQMMTAAGYDPKGFGDLLVRLDQWQDLRAEQIGIDPAKMEELSKQSGYPKIDDRVAALGISDTATGAVAEQDRLMGLIDGMKFDDRYDGGIIQDGKYWHPSYRISFDVPTQFFPEHGEYLQLLSVHGIVIVRVDSVEDATFDELIDRMGTSKLKFKGTKTDKINGISTASATTTNKEDGETFFGKVTIYDLDDKVASIIMFTKSTDFPKISPLYARLTRSVRRIDSDDIPARRTYKARRIGAEDTLASVASASRFDGDKDGQLRLLNSFEPGQALTAGDWIKLVE